MPETLSALYRAFARLEAGLNVSLGTTGLEPNPATTATLLRRHPPGPALGVWSSGSTGQPKFIWKDWSALKSATTTDERFRGWTWVSPFHATSFAGVHVALQAWRSSGRVLSLTNNWEQNWKGLAHHLPEAICCTPTFLDLLLQWNDQPAHGWQPRQITLGGEVLRPPIAARIQRAFPQARCTVIYASAEFGVLAKTNRLDGWYETASLNQYGRTWRVRDDTLELLRDGHWLSTKDRVEVEGDRFRVLGRADSVANVAGVKVSLAEITLAAEEVVGVRRAVAFFESNAILGQIVSLKFAVEAGAEPQEVERRLQAHLRQRLRKEAWPRRWIVDEVGLGKNAKGGAR